MNRSINLSVALLLTTSLLLTSCSKNETAPSTEKEVAKSESTPAESTTDTSAADSSPSSVENTATTTPFQDTVAQIPGTIEAENYDQGDPNIAYADVDEKNQGADDHRSATQVDIEKRDDASGGYGVGWTRKGEWLIYTVNVSKAGTYQVDIPVASDKQGGTFHIEFNGQNATGPIEVPDTGGWDKLQTITHNGIQLEAGQQTMKISMDTEGESSSIGDIDCLIFSLEEK